MSKGVGHVERAHGDRGAVLVEFAMVLPILAMLLFGLLSAGIAWNQNLALASAARSGGRYAATLPTTNYTSLNDYLDAIATRVIGSADGNLATTVAGRSICVAYVHPDGTETLDQNTSRTETGNGTVTRATGTNAKCFTDSQTSSDTRIQILVQRTGDIQTGIWTQNITITQKVVYRYEVSNGL